MDAGASLRGHVSIEPSPSPSPQPEPRTRVRARACRVRLPTSRARGPNPTPDPTPDPGPDPDPSPYSLTQVRLRPHAHVAAWRDLLPQRSAQLYDAVLDVNERVIDAARADGRTRCTRSTASRSSGRTSTSCRWVSSRHTTVTAPPSASATTRTPSVTGSASTCTTRRPVRFRVLRSSPAWSSPSSPASASLPTTPRCRRGAAGSASVSRTTCWCARGGEAAEVLTKRSPKKADEVEQLTWALHPSPTLTPSTSPRREWTKSCCA